MTKETAVPDAASVSRRTLDILREVTGDGELGVDLDVPLLDSGLVDSLAIVSLMVAFQDAFGLLISPADFDKETWSTPRALVADIERRLKKRSAA